MDMNEARQKLFEQALELDVDQREVLATQILLSLPEPDPEVEAAWKAEIERRVRRIQSGEDETVSWEDVRERLKERFG